MDQGLNCENSNPNLGRGKAASYGLVLACAEGRRRALQELVQAYEAVVIRIALNTTVSQDAGLQIYCRVFLYSAGILFYLGSR